MMISADARLGAVFINGVPSTEIAGCVVNRQHGIVTFGTWEDALQAHDRTKRRIREAVRQAASIRPRVGR